MKKEKIIIDTDPGIDDAVAISLGLFSPKLDINLLTSVSGNVDIEKTTTNCLKLLSFFDSKLKVAKGASSPLIRRAVFADHIHGESGMEGYDFEKINYDLLKKHSALDEMIEILEEDDQEITIVALGPLTNIAKLLIARRNIKKKIKRIVLMGGTFARGNFGIYSEFNFGVDPEAARIVFESGIDLRVMPLFVGQKAAIRKDLINEIKDFNKTGNMLYSLFKNYKSGSFKEGLNMYDVLTIAYLEDEDMFTMKKANVQIETQGDFTSGASLMDFDHDETNALVAVDIDLEKFNEWFKKAIKRCI